MVFDAGARTDENGALIRFDVSEFRRKMLIIRIEIPSVVRTITYKVEGIDDHVHTQTQAD